MERLEQHVNILLKNGFTQKKQSSPDVRELKNKNIYITVYSDSFFLHIYKSTKKYFCWDLNEFFSDQELQNLIFFSNLNIIDKNYFKKKLNYNNGNQNMIKEILNIHDKFEKIERVLFTKSAKEAFFKRKVMYQNFLEAYLIN